MAVKDKFENMEDLSNAFPSGKKTKKMLDKKGIKSPPLENMVKRDSRTWVVKKQPKE